MRTILNYLRQKPLVTKFVYIFILISSLLAVRFVQRTSYPQVDLHKVIIKTYYPGASSQDVEQNVTSILEREIKKVQGIETYSSVSIEGQSVITVVVDQDNKSAVASDIQRSIDGVNNLPSRVLEKPIVFEQKVENFPVYDIAIVDQTKSETELLVILKQLKRRLNEISDIKEIDISGERTTELQIELNLNYMNEQNISIPEVINVLQDNNIGSAGVKIESFVDEKKIITISKFDTQKKLESLIIRSNYDGKSIILSDIASISQGLSKQTIITSYNGQEGMGLWIYKKGQADIINTIESISKVVNDFKKDLGISTLSFVTTHDLSLETRSRLNMVYSNIFLGLLFVVVVLFIFLNFKIAFWVSMGIPFSLAILWILMPVFNITLNSISLCGLIIVLGMIVDDAIIVAQSIHSRDFESESFIDATLKVIRPITSTIVTTIIAFIPIYFIPGLIGQFVKEIPSVVIITLIGSLLESIIFLPIHLSQSKNHHSFSFGRNLMEKLTSLYKKTLLVVLENQKISWMTFTFIFIVTSFLAFNNLKVESFPEHQAQRLYIYGKVSSSKTLNVTREISKAVEEKLKSFPANTILSTRTRVGRSFKDQLYCEQCFYTKVELTPYHSRSINALEIEKIILSKLDEISGLFNYGVKIDSGAPPEKSDLEIIVLSKSFRERLRAVKKIESELSGYKLETDIEFSQNTYQLIPNLSTMSKFGVSVRDITNTMSVIYGGEVIGQFNDGQDLGRIRVLTSRNDLVDPLIGVKVLNSQNKLIALNMLVEVKKIDSLNSIQHFNGEESNTLFVFGAKGISLKKLRSTISRLKKESSSLDFIIRGKIIDSKESRINLIIIFAMSFLLIYFFLTIQFNSFIIPIIVTSSIPVGILGVLLTFNLHQMPISIMALVGLVGFSGVVINDALLMIEVLKEIQFNEGSRINSIVNGSAQRFSPIFLTTITTVAGLLPSIYGFLGGSDSFISPMVLTMASGLVFGTISDLYLIPLIFSSLNKKWKF